SAEQAAARRRRRLDPGPLAARTDWAQPEGQAGPAARAAPAGKPRAQRSTVPEPCRSPAARLRTTERARGTLATAAQAAPAAARGFPATSGAAAPARWAEWAAAPAATAARMAPRAARPALRGH